MTELLDPGEREHAIATIREWIEHPARFPSDISAERITSIVCKPLAAWLKKYRERNTATLAALDLLLYAEDMASRFSDSQTVIPEQVEKLDALWQAFQNAVGWGKVAKQSISNKLIASNPRKAAKVTREVLLAFRDSWFADKGHYQGWIKAAESKFGVSRDTINRRIK